MTDLVRRLRDVGSICCAAGDHISERHVTEAADRLELLETALEVERKKSDKLAGLLWEACGGFPVSEEAFAAVAGGLEETLCEMKRPFEGRSMDEFRADIERQIAALDGSAKDG